MPMVEDRLATLLLESEKAETVRRNRIRKEIPLCEVLAVIDGHIARCRDKMQHLREKRKELTKRGFYALKRGELRMERIRLEHLRRQLSGLRYSREAL